MTAGPGGDAEIRRLLVAPPRVPADPDLFTSNTLFGQPGIYPDGSPMAPATGPAPTEEQARRSLDDVLAARVARGAAIDVVDVRARFDDPTLVEAAPDAGVRAALLMLQATVAAPVARAFPATTPVRRLHFGVPASPGRVVGPASDSATGSDPDGATRVRVVNERYAGEHPALIASSLAHDLLWSPATTGHAAEAMLHAIVAMVHLQLIAAHPSLARAGTELARRQNSLAITLLNSRRPGSSRVEIRCPDGPGTIPGGAPSMQSVDFWTIPFGPERDDDVPALLRAVLDELVDGGTPRPDPLRFDEPLGAWLSAEMDDRWLSPQDQLAASHVLGLLPAEAQSAAVG